MKKSKKYSNDMGDSDNPPRFKDRYELSREALARGEHPSGNSFLTNPVASDTDCTGFAVTVPHNDAEAKSRSRLCGDVPVTSHTEKGVKGNRDEEKKRK